MRWFRWGRDRRRAVPSDAPADGALPELTVDQAARLASTARQAFAECGVETVIGDGALHGADGNVLGLSNLAQIAAGTPEREWPSLLRRHAQVMVAAQELPVPQDLDAVRDQVFLRVLPAADLPFPVVDPLMSVGDLVGVLSIDYPEHISTLTRAEDIERLGGRDAVHEVAHTNLLGLRADTVTVLGGDDPDQGTVHLSLGGFFNASRMFVLDAVLRQDFGLESPSHGVLVAVPNRHVLAVHPLTGIDCVQAVQTLVALARGESDRPGGVSPHVYYWRDRRWEQVTRDSDDGSIEVDATGMFGEAMKEIGLLGED
ncbi:hypothetical protein [Actinotalea sp. K2]|uniref:hypothetical protein n=1 Tax=Actinotalea sp. K2 TaxID=2939438 RepID=UPI00201810BD|nr:hypothetical protein [Actinotalea sp. K2]MCL3860769.1 hypothetical protein [Actinotalea sp. K2]